MTQAAQGPEPAPPWPASQRRWADTIERLRESDRPSSGARAGRVQQAPFKGRQALCDLVGQDNPPSCALTSRAPLLSFTQARVLPLIGCLPKHAMTENPSAAGRLQQRFALSPRRGKQAQTAQEVLGLSRRTTRHPKHGAGVQLR